MLLRVQCVGNRATGHAVVERGSGVHGDAGMRVRVLLLELLMGLLLGPARVTVQRVRRVGPATFSTETLTAVRFVPLIGAEGWGAGPPQ